VERVADEDDPRLERDILPRETIRVPLAVEALVSASDDAADLRELLEEWIEESYRTIAPKRLVAELDARPG